MLINSGQEVDNKRDDENYQKEIKQDFGYGCEAFGYYHGDATFATDGLCELACPGDVNTEKLIIELRFDTNSATGNRIASWMTEHMNVTSAMGRLVLGTVRGYSTSRTCEICLSLHSGVSYNSIVYLVDKATQVNSD